MYTVKIMDAVASGANLTSSEMVYEYPQGLNGCKFTCEKGNMSIEVISTANGTTGVVKLMAADTSGGTYLDVTDANITLTSATTFAIAPITNCSRKFYKIDYEKGNNTTGEVTVNVTFS